MKKSSPTYRRRVAAFMTQRWSVTRIRKKLRKALRRSWNDPDRRRKAAEYARRQWSRPSMRRRLCASMRRPWTDPAHVARMSAISKARWRDPRTRPLLLANAKRALGPSVGAKRLHRLLGDGWYLEFYTPLGPIDIANPTKRIAIEVDDPGHRRTKQMVRDRRKAAHLRRRGWVLYRIPESHAQSVAL